MNSYQRDFSFVGFRDFVAGFDFEHVAARSVDQNESDIWKVKFKFKLISYKEEHCFRLLLISLPVFFSISSIRTWNSEKTLVFINWADKLCTFSSFEIVE